IGTGSAGVDIAVPVLGVRHDRVGEFRVAPSGAASSVEQEVGADQEANTRARGGKAVEGGCQRARESTSGLEDSFLRRFDVGRAVVDLKPDDPALSPLPIVAGVAAEDRAPEPGCVQEKLLEDVLVRPI